MRRIASFILLTLTVKTVCAYPISPQTLRKLIANSQYIIIATIDNPDPKDEPVKYFDKSKNDTVIAYRTFWGGDGIADLCIKEILKGNPYNKQHISVSYEAGMICPAPAYYPDKKVVIAFLGKKDSSRTYYTVGLSYGSKIMENEAEINSFRTRIIEYLEILKIKNEHNRNLATVEWLVKCAENKYTRWEGAYEFSRRGYFMSYYDYSNDEQFFKNLNTNQLHRLDSAFFATDTVSYSELCLANLITKANHLKLRQHLIKNLEFADYYIATDIMKKIIEISPRAELKEIYNEADNLSYSDNERETKQKQLIQKFIAKAKEN